MLETLKGIGSEPTVTSKTLGFTTISTVGTAERSLKINIGLARIIMRRKMKNF